MRSLWRVSAPLSVTAILAPLLLLPALAHAQWQVGGNRIGEGAGHYREFAATASGSDRVVVAWIHKSALGAFEIRARAWTSDGLPLAGWPEAGVLVSSVAGDNQTVAITDDGANGAFVTWTNAGTTDQSAWLQHVTGDGTIASGWSPDGIRLGPSYLYVPPAIAADGRGGVLVGRFQYGANYGFKQDVHHIDAAGTPNPDWPADGLSLPYEEALGLLVDQGRIYVSTVVYDLVTQSWTGLIVRRLDMSGSPDPSWPQGGTVLAGGRYAAGTRLFQDGSGGVFTGWYVYVACVDICPPTATHEASRVLSDGSADPRWPPARLAYSLAPDQTGGMLLGMQVDGRPGVLRVDDGGAPMPGWSPEGNPAIDVRLTMSEVTLGGDGHGGAFITWVDSRTGTQRLYASRLDPSGGRPSEWPATGSFVDAGRAMSYAPQLIALKPDVAVVVWEELDAAHGTYAGYVTALRPGSPGPVPPPTGGYTFGIQLAGPNPTIGAIDAIVQLRGEEPARLELIDAAGRVRESREGFQTPGPSPVRFNQSASLPAGVYWLQLTQAGQVATHKVVVLR